MYETLENLGIGRHGGSAEATSSSESVDRSSLGVVFLSLLFQTGAGVWRGYEDVLIEYCQAAMTVTSECDEMDGGAPVSDGSSLR